MADSKNTNQGKASNFLPNFYKTDANKKFLQATIDQLIQPGTVKKLNGFIGRQNAKATEGSDIFVEELSNNRQDYQLEPSFTIKDDLGNTTFFKDYADYINQLEVFNSITNNHSRINSQEFYSWDPHINWDKFVNFQNYYWLPFGPDVINVAGQQQEIVSTYDVVLETTPDSVAYIFSPKGSVGLVRNPTIRLYKGQTYKFDIVSPGQPFSIKTQRVGGRANRYSIPTLEGAAVENGTITFTVPFDAPDLLYYVSENDVDLGGAFEILSITENTVIDVEKEILGKKTYTLANGTSLSNGMKVRFIGKVSPEEYSAGQYYVEGVGDSIRLIDEKILEIISQYTETQSILFDNNPFDTLPFSDATAYAGSPDYIVINRGSDDRNAWSRYNRWFHKDVIEISASLNGKVPSLNQSARAVRPIIEFEPNLKLFNFGTTALSNVDLIDDYTNDVFSKIEGQLGYNIDGIPLAQNQRILFTADTDNLVRNKIFRVNFLTLNGVRQIHLVEEETPIDLNVVLVKQGKKNQGLMYWYDGTTWNLGQQKTELNQAPLFDIVDSNKISYGDKETYDGTTFVGTKIFSYKIGNGTTDPNLGFALSYKNISNIGDIVFNFNLATDAFQYKDVVDIKQNYVNVGFLVNTVNGKVNYLNGWQKCTIDNVQPAIRIYKNSGLTNNFDIDIFDNIDNLSDLVIRLYVNGIRLDQKNSTNSTLNWTVTDNVKYKTIVLQNDILLSDVLTIKAFASQPINDNGYYEIPINLQNNPLNALGDYSQSQQLSCDFTLGEVIDHVNSIVENTPSFIGSNPGLNNMRDLGNITQYGTRFVQHSGPLSLSMYHITSENNNIVRAIESARNDYNKFKRTFISVAEKLGVDADPVKQVELIMQKINKDKSTTFPYYFSDMVPYGASVRNDYTVVDYRIKTYPLTNVFDVSSLSDKAVLVYHTNSNNEVTHLLYGRDYVFDSQGFVVISSTIEEDDTITIYEFDTTNGSFVPPTPTKLGLWPKYQPMIYTDTSLVTPRLMIQGHDGSQVLAYGDYRDDVILELEKRIFNNIKVEYDPTVFDLFDVIPGYNRTTRYSLEEFNQILSPNFYKWTSFIDKDFSKPLSYDRNNELTYNYRGHVAPDGREVPGYWKGIYLWMLDTDRPNICPWEMLGLSEEPKWWQSVYGPAPYTKDNLILWTDLSQGFIREPGKPLVKVDKCVRPFLIDHIPVDEYGNIVSPIQSGLANGIITQSTEGDFAFGDVSPVESAWRRSSHYSFSVIIAAMLMYPAKTFGVLLDRSRIVRNLAGQLVYSDTGLRIAPKDVLLPNIYSSKTGNLTSGIINYVVDYILSDNLKSYETYQYDLKNIKAQLSYRVGGFTSKEKFKFLLDSKTPLSSGSVFIPQEDYDIILNNSSPIKKITYSGVIIIKVEDGFEIKGYSKVQPYFKYYNWLRSGKGINVGGISESYLIWTPGERYAAGTIVKYNNVYYRVKTTHIAEDVIDLKYCESLPSLPYVGGRDATLRTEWIRDQEKILPYGTKIRDIQEVFDFLLGYGEWLKDQGFIFDEFNTSLNAVTNWETSAKEFLFWTTQNWSTGEDKWQEWLPNEDIPYQAIVRYNGDYYQAIRKSLASPIFNEEDFVQLDGLSTVGSSVLSLSPGAIKLTFSTPLSVVDDIRNEFNGYEIFKVDGTPIAPSFINSYREDNAVSYAPEGEYGIYCATFYLKQQEQVVLLNNTTMFNDTIYHPVSGYRQERIKVAGYKTSSWNGSFSAPGFIFDRAIIQEWESWKDYNLGDIVKYKEFYYSAKTFLPGVEKINLNDWVKLDEKPTPKLIPNWNYKASQFEDFYNLDSDNFDSDQQTVAQHLIGYQKREYLSNIIKDDVSEYKFYQGMIVEKGTQNVLNKLFDVLSAEGEESLTFYEEWALRVANYGANNAFETIEFILDESEFKMNPQGFELVANVSSKKTDFISRQGINDVYVKPIGYNTNPWPVNTNYIPYLRSAGYVRPEDVQLILRNINDILAETVWSETVEYTVNSTVTYEAVTYIAVVSNQNQIPSPTSDYWKIHTIDDYTVGNYVWCGFEGQSWNVYRFTNSNVTASEINYENNILSIKLNSLVPFTENTYIGIPNLDIIKGFYKIQTVTLDTFTLSATIENWDENIDLSQLVILELTSQRIDSIDQLDNIELQNRRELVWTDDSGNGKWATWRYNTVYSINDVVNTSPQEVNSEVIKFGKDVVINNNANILTISNSIGEIIVYDKASPVSPWIQRQTIVSPFISKSVGMFDPTPPELTGDVLAISPDNRWFATGTPAASAACTRFIGAFNSLSLYNEGDIVSYDSNYYEARSDLTSTNLVPTDNSTYWRKIFYIPVSPDGENSLLDNQGVISIYEKDKNNIFTLIDTIVSPVPQIDEFFGSDIVFGINKMFVSATGTDSNTGAVYEFSYLDRIEASSYYNPVGSSGTTIKVSSTTNIQPNMKVVGEGFTSNQIVAQVIDSTTLLLNAAPDSEPLGQLDFVISSWGFDSLTGLSATITTGDNFGYKLSISKDNSTLAVSSIRSTNFGKVFVYKNINDTYTLIDTILPEVEDVSNPIRFGEFSTISDDGFYIAISSKTFDGLAVDQGNVSIYRYSNNEYIKHQDLTNRNPEAQGFFGTKVFFMNNYKTLVVYSENADSYTPMLFSDMTTFDAGLTRFVDSRINSGRVDIYDNYGSNWVFSESLEVELEEIDQYGAGISVGSNHVIVTAPNAFDGTIRSGRVYEHVKIDGTYSWTKIHEESEKIDVKKIKRAFLYNKSTNNLITYLDALDPLQGKIPGPAEQEIKFKAFYDPAVYSVGTDQVVVDDGISWNKSQVGSLWWDLRTTKFIDSSSVDVIYRNGSWNTLFPGASVDIYEWVETDLLPEDWDSLTDTEAGIAEGISGQSLYGAGVYSVTKKYDNISKTYTETYYYWVKNKKTIPSIFSRTMSAQDVANLIENPRGEGYSFIGFTGTNTFSLINVKPLLEDKDVVLSVDYWTVDNIKQNIHSQWKIIDGDITTQIPAEIESKWFDSLCGKDQYDRLVPDMALPPKLRYGIENRPRQGMFINRFEALKQIIEQTNQVLINYKTTDQRDLSKLEEYDAEPSTIFGLYDVVLDTDAELRFAGAGTFTKPTLIPVITNGRITSVTIQNKGSGFGRLKPKKYDAEGTAIEWVGPSVNVLGSGINAELTTTINSRGQIIRVDVISSGYGYDSNTIIVVRNYAALVHSDTQANSGWSIYTYELTSQTWSRTRSQSFDTRRYWNYADWYETGYNQFTAFDYSVSTFADLLSLETDVGELVKIRTTNLGKWMLLEKYNNSTSVDWTQSYKLVGLQDGTIQFSSTLYQYIGTIYGYDGSLYDTSGFDNAASLEIRFILEALRDNILIEDLRSEYLNLFFTNIRYLLTEQLYVDWIFKTSFVKARHNVGELKQKVTYNNDNLSDFESYVSEVKPYRTQIREYVSLYSKIDNTNTSITDFDLLPVYENGSLSIIDSLVVNDQIYVDNNAILSYPWKHWWDNVGFTVTELRIVDGGAGYVSEPVVRFESASGSKADARAYIANGKVNRIILISGGEKYLSAPKVVIDGGLADGGTPARVVAIIGGGVVRSNFVKMKFDRITSTYFITQLQETETFTGTGLRVQFPLTWAPDIRIGQSTVIVNGIDELRDNYKLSIVKSTNRGYTSYSGSITFDTAPSADSVIQVTYLKDWSLLNAADRVQYYYNPTTGQLGKDLAQLMTGIDYGGVVVNGLGFDVGAGWDSVPYYIDKWDSFDSTFDDYIVTVSAGTNTFTLPYIPDTGTEINVYYSRLESVEYVSDGDTTGYIFDSKVIYPPTVTVSTTTTSTGTNAQGSFILNVASTTGVSVGDIVSITPVVPNTLGYNTTVTEVINLTSVRLDQILFKNVPAASTIKFERELIVPTDCIINQNGTIFLNEPVTLGSVITISSPLRPVRIDDPDFGTVDQTNPNAVMQTWIALNDQNTITIDIDDFETVFPAGIQDGDKFILRKSTSDGSIKPQDLDYDTSLSGGDLAYSTATGIAAEDIIVDGDGFVTPTTSTAPEEVVPGQVVDAVAIKVYDRPNSGSANIKIDSYVGDGETLEFAITQRINSNRAVVVKIETGIAAFSNIPSSTQTEFMEFGVDYSVNYVDSTVTFVNPPAEGSVISLFSFGFNGSNIIDLDYFVTDGVTKEIITNATWVENFVALVYVNGVIISPPDIEYFKTENNYSDPNRIGIRFQFTPDENKLVNYIIVSGSEQTFSITKTQRITPTGALQYNLLYNAGTNLPIESNMVVRVDNRILKAPVNSYFVIKNNRLNYKLDTTKFAPYSVAASDIAVIANQNLLVANRDYVVDTGGINIKINKSVYDLYSGKELIISVKAGQGYFYVAGPQPSIIFSEGYNNNEVIEVISMYNHNILDVQRTAIKVSNTTTLTPGTVEYINFVKISTGKILLDRSVLDDNYIWVVKNETLLTPSVDYKLNPDRTSITLAREPDVNDEFTLITFSENVLTTGVAYMQFKDMLNRVHFKRLSQNKQSRLADDLNYNDLVIKVEDASNFDTPNRSSNKPGVVEIRGERIEFFSVTTEEFTDVDGTRTVYVLGQLRRGTLGTGASRVHKKGSVVQDIGPSETIPYVENPVIEQVVSDGTDIIKLSFVPKRATVSGTTSMTKTYSTELVEWEYEDVNFESNIPAGYGQADDIEVFVGGYNISEYWKPNTIYNVDDIVMIGSYTYRATARFTTGDEFNSPVTIVNESNEIVTENVNYSSVWSYFIGNIRLKKKPYTAHNVNQHPESRLGNNLYGDVQFDAEFAVDGESAEIRLTNQLTFGTQVTVIKRTGKDWDSTTNIQYSDNRIAKFLKATPGIWYTPIDKYESKANLASTFDSVNGTFDSTSITFDQG